MKISKSMKRSPGHADFASSGWTIELCPEDLGFPPPPYTLEQARQIIMTLRHECQLQCCGAMVAEGLISEQEFHSLVGDLDNVSCGSEGCTKGSKE